MRLLTGLLLILIGVSLFAQNVGDTLTLKVNHFSTPLAREEQTGFIRKVGTHGIYVTLIPENFYTFTRIDVTGPADSMKFIAGTQGDYLFWYNIPHKVAMLWQRLEPATPTVFDVFATMANNRRGYFIVATEEGIVYSRSTPYGGLSWTAKNVVDSLTGDTLAPIYSLAINPLTTDPNFGVVVGTPNGVYKGTGLNGPWGPLGLSGDTVVALAFDPLDTSIVYAGTKTGLYVYIGGAFQNYTPSGLTNPEITRIRAIAKDASTSLVVASTHEGLYYAEVSGGSVVGGSFNLVQGTSSWDISDVDLVSESEVIVAVPGEGVYKSQGDITSAPNWETLNTGLAEYDDLLHTLNVFSLRVYDSGHYFAATPYGIYEYTESSGKWLGWREGMPGIITDAFVDDVSNWFEASYDSILTLLGVDPSELYDVDNTPQLYIFITDLYIGGVAFATYGPIYGYFDPVDEVDSLNGSFKDLIVVNHTYLSDLTDENAGPWVIPYLFGRYVTWSLDHDEEPYLMSGIGMLAAELMGYPIHWDYLSQSVPPAPTVPGPNVWSSSNLLETQRHRLIALSWNNYLMYELADSSLDFIKMILRDSINQGWSSWDSLLNVVYGLSYTEALKGWYIKILQDGYIDLTSLLDPMGESATPVGIDPAGAYYWRLNSADTLIRANAEDDKECFYVLVKGDSLDDVVDLTPTMDTLKRIIYNNSDGDSGVFIFVNAEATEANNHVFSTDFVSPEGTLFTLQNSIYDVYFTLYAIANDHLVSDVSALTPDYLLIKVDTVDSIVERGTFEDWFTGQDTLGNPIYGYKAYSRANVTGDIVYYLWAQDVSGNELVSADTFSIQWITPEGGDYMALNGDVRLIVPEGAVARDIYMIINESDENVLNLASLVKRDDFSYGVSPVYFLGSDEIVFSKPVDLSLPIEKAKDVSIYRYSNGNWQALPSHISQGRVWAKIVQGGIYQVRTGHVPTMSPSTYLGFAVPNPADDDGSVIIPFSISDDGYVSLKVYDVSGRLVKTLISGVLKRGEHSAIWNLRDFAGRKVAQGVYFYRFEYKGFNSSKKLVILK